MVATIKTARNREQWEQLLANSICNPEEISDLFELDRSHIAKVVSFYPMLINPYFMGLIKSRDDAIYNQMIPDIREITQTDGLVDPLAEEDLSPVPGLTHKYPDRVLLLVSSRCASYCRFCNRKRKVGNPAIVTNKTIHEGIRYIRHTKSIRDVLLSGGDPLILSDNDLFNILNKIRSIPHVEIIRIGTRVPCTLPHRVTSSLVKVLQGFHPLYINTHFNHPDEITVESASACKRLADAGIPMGCQTVLLKGVNDDPGLIQELMQRLLTIRVKPYYLFQADLAKGTSHFWTPLNTGIRIIEHLQGNTSGMCLPRFVIDLPRGGGKVPVCPEYIKAREGDTLLIKNYKGKEYRYPIIE